MYYFFNPDTLNIIASSDSVEALEFPCIWDDEYYHSFENLKAQRNDEDQTAYEALALEMTQLIQGQQSGDALSTVDFIEARDAIKEQMKDPNSRAQLIITAG